MSVEVANAGAPKLGGIKKKRTAGATKMNWATYLYKIKKQVHPDVGMASDAMYTLNSIIEDYKERMIKESFKSAEDTGSSTVKAKHARAAAALMLDGDILKYTNTEGEKACTKFAHA
jgi:histone H2B